MNTQCNNTMKTKLTIILSVLLIAAAGCASLRMTPEEKARMVQTVQDSLENRSFRIDVDRMLPLRGPSRILNGGWFLRVKDRRLISYLPYFGIAYNLPYGGGDGLNFEEKILDWREGRIRADMHEIMLEVSHEQDRLLYIIHVFDNGKSDIEIRSRNRETIRFMGEMHVSYTNSASLSVSGTELALP